ncbi:MAG TPA: diacylglycerol kinase family protein [Solirubrobacterales bacterium]
MQIDGMPLTLIVNPSSAGGRSLKLLPRVEAALDARRAVFRVEKTRSLEHGVELALRAIELGEVPVVVSGDGLLGAVGGAMAGSETPLGLIPGGRGNDLARALGIPSGPEDAVDVVLGGHSRTIDVGEANGKRFLGIVSVGFDSECNRLANETSFIRGNWVYAYSMVRTLIGWKPARFTLAVGEERKRISGYFVDVANNSVYGGGMYIAPEAELDDGEFDVVSIGEGGKLRFLLGLRDVLKGEHLDKDEVSVFRTPRLELDASRPFPVYADGDHLTDLPVSLRVLPRCLSILVPGDEGA